MVFGGIAEGNKDNRLDVLGQTEGILHTISIEIAYPAGAEALLGGSQAEVLSRDGHIDVSVVFPVATTFP